MDEMIPRRQSPLGPLLLGFFLAVILVGAIGFAYFKTQVNAPAPSPSPTATPAPSPSPSPTPEDSPLPTRKPVASTKPKSSSPTPTPVPRPTLDIRFGNPSASVKQTFDDGSGDGRVINREYTSVQGGQFDELPSAWSPRVTVCFHFVSGESILGKDLKFSMSLDDKIEVEDNMSWLDRLEAGKIYDWCHDVTTGIGKHTARLLLNPDKSLKEANYVNDVSRLDWENLADNIAPNFSLMGPINEGASGTCLSPQYVTDNVTPYASLKIEQKIDSADWITYVGSRYCFVGTSGSTHSYAIRISDARGNKNEQSKTFVLY